MVKRSGTTPKRCEAEGLAQAAESGDHLVEDEEDAVPRADLAQALEIAFRRHQHAGRARHRLDDHRRDGRRVVQRAEPLQLVRKLQTRIWLSARERISSEVMRMADMVDAGYARSEHLLVRLQPADRHAAEVDAVVAALAADQAEALPLRRAPDGRRARS